MRPQDNLNNQIETIHWHKILLDYRKLHNLKQIDMARLLKCTQSQYSLWETGKTAPNPLRERDILEIIK